MSHGSSEVTEVSVDPERGTREKRFRDGRREVWYSNGNRKEVSSDGQTVKVSLPGKFDTDTKYLQIPINNLKRPFNCTSKNKIFTAVSRQSKNLYSCLEY